MSSRDAGILVCRVFSALVVLRMIPMLVVTLYAAVAGHSGAASGAGVRLLSILYDVGVLAGCVALWQHAPRAADYMVSGTDAGAASPMTIDGLHVVAFSTVGLVVLAKAVPDAALQLLIWLRSLGRPGLPAFQRSLWIPAIVFTLKFAIGFWLLLGARSIVGAITRRRES